MNIYVGLTDRTWFDYLRHRNDLDEVNFWVPGKTITLPRLQPGELLLFELHSHDFSCWLGCAGEEKTGIE
jgi:putative restriction endonuclease